ncbi:MAG TPA: hypothetical protein VFB95_04285 [Candidatus Cryosericum sp.]|nr:hypothetical protein [Candidatus Cryosericum sp.]
MTPGLRAALRRLASVRDDEAQALVWSGLFCFLVFAGWYILRPLREEMGIAGGVRNLPWMFTGTLLATLLASPLFSALVSRCSRRRFIPAAFHFFAANLVLFFVLFRLLPEAGRAGAARAFYIWTSVFNLFVVSLFWAYMADIFRSDQGKRLFGFISAGGTLGGIAGSLLTASTVGIVGSTSLLLLAAVLMEASLVGFGRLESLSAARGTAAGAGAAPVAARLDRTGAWGGLTLVLRSPYLLVIALCMLLFTTTSTFVYLEQARIIEAASASPEARTAIFARIDLLVNVLALLGQALLTGRIIAAIGLGPTQAILPAVSLCGFAALVPFPMLSVLAAFQVARRASDYATAKPAREVLYTVLPTEEKYKAKSFIDTFVYRGGDAAGAWVYKILTSSGDPARRVLLASLPIVVLWMGLSLLLGRWQRSRAAAQTGRYETSGGTPTPDGSIGASPVTRAPDAGDAPAG